MRSLYFLVKNHTPHTTTFHGLVTLKVENGDIKLKTHRDQCPGNAAYESYATVSELLASISNILENSLLSSLKASRYFSLMADEGTDVASKEELNKSSINCANLRSMHNCVFSIFVWTII